jgi:SAM-dependent methyltransferase
MSQANSYSRSWFEFFHVPIGEERTQREVDFICAMAPLPGFRRVLDVCCGMGRHARSLAHQGYAVTGVERDAAAITRARELGGGVEYIETDVRHYRPVEATYDLAVIMSQSFGHFDASANRQILARLAHGIRKGGRVILDLWNPEFFAAHQDDRDLQTPAGVVLEQKQFKDGRLFVRLTYPDGSEENFEWQLFTPTEMEALADSLGFALAVACAGFSATTEANSGDPRIQFVLERRKKS